MTSNIHGKANEQVSLFKLVFTHNWEDPLSDHSALDIQSKDAVFAITSGGCNVLGFLKFDPSIVYSIDVNPTQSFLLELKIAAIKCLEFEDFVSFAGLKPHSERMRLYHTLRTALSDEALKFWDQQKGILTDGFIMNGKYERFIKLAGKFLQLLQGKKRVFGLFDATSKEEQEKYFDDVWNTKRFRLLFTILFNKRMLARRGLVSNYFQFDDGSKSFAESFYNRSKKAFRSIPLQGNYFLSLYLFGKYRSDRDVPDYLKQENFYTIKSRIDRIKIVTCDAQGWLGSLPAESIDCFALSNICELMSENENHRLFDAVYRTARPDAKIIFRNLMVPREVPNDLRNQIVKNEKLSKLLVEEDRSFVYGKVAAYRVKKIQTAV